MSIGLKAREQAHFLFKLVVLMSPNSLFDLGRKVCFQADLNPHSTVQTDQEIVRSIGIRAAILKQLLLTLF